MNLDWLGDKNLQRIYRLAFVSAIVGAFLFFVWSAYDAQYILNPDGVSYISIARQYAAGHFSTAVSTLLPPLLSWLMIPFLKLGITGQVAFMSLNTIIATAILVVGMLFVKRQTKSYPLSIFFALAISPFLVYAIGRTITPDLLVVLWVLLFWLVLLKASRWLETNNNKGRLKAGLLLGFTGAIGYFTKQFVFPFFISSLFLWALWRTFTYKKPKRRLPPLKDWLKSASIIGITLLVFVVAAAPWLIAISKKYGGFTLGNSIGATFSRFSDSGTVSPQDLPRIALLDPPNQYAVSYQECRGCIKSQVSSTAKTSFSVGYFLKDKLKSVPLYIRRVEHMGWFIVPFMGLLAILFFGKKLSYKKDTAAAIGSLLLTVYFGGYAATLSSNAPSSSIRYVWPLLCLSILIVALLMPKLGTIKYKRLRPYAKVLPWLVCSVVVISTFWVYWSSVRGLPVNPLKPPIKVVAEDLQQQMIIPAGAKLAGNNSRPTTSLAYYLGAQTYGSIDRNGSESPKFNDPEVQQVLHAKGIDFYVNFSLLKPVDAELEVGGAKIVKSYNAILNCENIRDAKALPCVVTIVKLKK